MRCVTRSKDHERIGTSNASLSTISSTFNSLFKVLCIFPSRYLCAIGLSRLFSFRWNLPPIFGLHSQTTRLIDHSTHCFTERQPCEPWTGLSPSLMPCSKGLWLCWFRVDEKWSQDYNSEANLISRTHLSFNRQIHTEKAPDFKLELIPVHSPLLRESSLVSFPPLIDMLKFSGLSYLIW